METYRNILVYDLTSYLIITSTVKQRNSFRILKVRKETNSLEIQEEPPFATQFEFDEHLKRELPQDKAKPIAQGHAILGLPRFLQGFYLFLVTKKQKIGEIREQSIYRIQRTQLLKLFSEPTSKTEQKYLDLFNSLDISLGFYYSHIYNLTSTLQENVANSFGKPQVSAHSYRRSRTGYSPTMHKLATYKWKTMYVWNHEHLKTFTFVLKDTQWVTPIIHGYIGYKRLFILGKTYDLVLISRRSRYFAGTRYLKRGLNEEGKVANDVETEQILVEKMRHSNISSFVHVRGSIPLFWCQEPNPVIPPPAIIFNQNDFLREGTRRHIADLYHRYGAPLMVLNLLKAEARSREYVITQEYANCIEYLNERMPTEYHIDYTHFDIKNSRKASQQGCIQQLYDVAKEKLAKTSVFYTEPRGSGVTCHFQVGVIRTNCIDCIDRTNSAMMFIGHKALEKQLIQMKVVKRLNSDSHVLAVLSGLYEEMGDIIALQYSGSEAHRQFSRENMHRASSVITSFKRHWANLITDSKKQQVINLFLGVFKPYSHHVHLWEIEDDSKLHNLNRRIYEISPNWWEIEHKRFTSKLGLCSQESKTSDNSFGKTRKQQSPFKRDFEDSIPLLIQPYSMTISSMDKYMSETYSISTSIVVSRSEIEPDKETSEEEDKEDVNRDACFEIELDENTLKAIETYMENKTHLDQKNLVAEPLDDIDFDCYISNIVKQDDYDFSWYFDLEFNEDLLTKLEHKVINGLVNN